MGGTGRLHPVPLKVTGGRSFGGGNAARPVLAVDALFARVRAHGPAFHELGFAGDPRVGSVSAVQLSADTERTQPSAVQTALLDARGRGAIDARMENDGPMVEIALDWPAPLDDLAGHRCILDYSSLCDCMEEVVWSLSNAEEDERLLGPLTWRRIHLDEEHAGRLRYLDAIARLRESACELRRHVGEDSAIDASTENPVTLAMLTATAVALDDLTEARRAVDHVIAASADLVRVVESPSEWRYLTHEEFSQEFGLALELIEERYGNALQRLEGVNDTNAAMPVVAGVAGELSSAEAPLESEFAVCVLAFQRVRAAIEARNAGEAAVGLQDAELVVENLARTVERYQEGLVEGAGMGAELIRLAVQSTPGAGSLVLLGEAVAGRTITGREMSDDERWVEGLFGGLCLLLDGALAVRTASGPGFGAAVAEEATRLAGATGRDLSAVRPWLEQVASRVRPADRTLVDDIVGSMNSGRAPDARQLARFEELMDRCRLPGTSGGSAAELRTRLFESRAITGSPSLPAGSGATNRFGDVVYSTLGTAEDVDLARFHEMVHSFLSPSLRFLRTFRADLGMAAYNRSSFLRYLEEAVAETYTQARVNGWRGIPDGIRFPISNGYVTIGRTLGEGALGTIVVGGTVYAVYTESQGD